MGHIACLHQVGLPAYPPVFLVDDPRRAQHAHKLSIVAMHVADGYDPLDSAPSIFRCGVRGRGGKLSERHANNDEEKPKTLVQRFHW